MDTKIIHDQSDEYMSHFIFKPLKRIFLDTLGDAASKLLNHFFNPHFLFSRIHFTFPKLIHHLLRAYQSVYIIVGAM